MISPAVASVKRRFDTNPLLYRTAFGLATFNLDYCKQRLHRARYPSRFGGLWTDRVDYEDQLRRRLSRGEVAEDKVDNLNSWREQGFLKLDNAVDHRLIDDYLDGLESLKARSPSPLCVTSSTLKSPMPYSAEVFSGNSSSRIVDDYFYSESARRLLFHRSITEYLSLFLESEPVLTQSLSFETGSEQAVHQDTAFVRMNAPMKFIGAWIALEDIQPGTGELVYYPESHHWPDFLFSRFFKHYDSDRDGEAQLHNWLAWIHEEARNRSQRLSSFFPKKGDVLFWHPALAHGGAPINNDSGTRRSLVSHYCAKGVRPLYHYYKPAQRKRYHWKGCTYTSAYYRSGSAG